MRTLREYLQHAGVQREKCDATTDAPTAVSFGAERAPLGAAAVAADPRAAVDQTNQRHEHDERGAEREQGRVAIIML